MKLFLFVLLISSVNYNFGQANHFHSREYYYSPPKLDKEYLAVMFPPGTTRLNDSVFIDETPINNLMFLEFLNNAKCFWSLEVSEIIRTIPLYGISKQYLKSKFDSISIDNSLYNSLLIKENKKINNKISINLYQKHPDYYYFPVLYTTKKQAKLYCKWRTDMVKLLLASNFKSLEERKDLPLNFEFRLPKKEEMIEAIDQFGYAYNPKLKKPKNIPVFPYKQRSKVILKIGAFIKYNSNLSEYLLDQETPFGTNWRNTLEFNESNDYTGFRCVCEIKD